jgi:hypothetical protein
MDESSEAQRPASKSPPESIQIEEENEGNRQSPRKGRKK